MYRLTEKGRDLAPVLLEMIVWSGKYDPDTLVTADYLDRARSRRASVIAQMKRAARS